MPEEKYGRVWVHCHRLAEQRHQASCRGDAEAVRVYTKLLADAWDSWRRRRAALDAADEQYELFHFAGSTHNLAGVPRPKWELTPIMWQSDITSLHGRRRQVPDMSASTSSGEIRFLELSPVGAVKREFLRQGGWHIRDFSSSIAGAGRPRQGLSDDPLTEALMELPYAIADLRDAIKAGRHRTREQQAAYDALAVFAAYRKPNANSLAETLRCSRDTIYELRKKGTALLADLKEEIRREIDESNERQLQLILVALGLNPVSEAEKALADEVEREI